jgi:chaperonin cofactor prefoldin
MKHDDTIVHGERLDRLEARNARLQEQSAIAEEHLQQLRSEVHSV